MNKDQVKGNISKAKGSIKETTGKVFGDKDMENKGKVQNAAGKAQTGFGSLKEEIKKQD